MNTEHDTTFEEQTIAKFAEEDSVDGTNEESKTEEKESEKAPTEKASGEEGEGGNASSDEEEGGKEDGDKKGGVGSEVNYALYQAVWGFQKWLKKPNLSLTSPAEWAAFTKDANVVLKAFEARAFKPHELAQGRSNYLSKREAPLPPATGGGGGGSNADSNKSRSSTGGDLTPAKGGAASSTAAAPDEGAASCKYLTASRLLRLQVSA